MHLTGKKKASSIVQPFSRWIELPKKFSEKNIMDAHASMRILVSIVIMASGWGCGGSTGDTKNIPAASSVAAEVKDLEKRVKPEFDKLSEQLDSETTKRETEAAKMSRRTETSEWSADIVNLGIERDKLTRGLEIEKRYLQKLLTFTNDPAVKSEIEETVGHALEKRSLEVSKRLAEIDRDRKDLDVKLKLFRLDVENTYKKGKIESEYRNEVLNLERERLNQQREELRKANERLNGSNHR
jgi:hypothetical protein